MTSGRQGGRRRTAAGLLLLGACSGSLPPLRGQMEVGRDAYAVFVAAGGAAGGDLYAVRTEGGPVVPITFSNVGELRPVLSPDGTAIAFLRGRSLRDTTPASVWVIDLGTGADREVELPRGAGTPTRVGWAPGGRLLVVATSAGLYRSAVPSARTKAEPVPPADRAAAESSLAVLLGEPAFTRVVPCAERGDLCVQGDTGAPGPLAREAHDPLRWGDDSVAFFRGDEVEIRPLGPGRPRLLDWANPPSRPREMTVFLGAKKAEK